MKPTILIFLKAPVRGEVKTRLAADLGEDAALEIYQKLVTHQMAALPRDWPVEVHFAPADAGATMRAWLGEAEGRSYVPQSEGDLGCRLREATWGAFARGAEAVCLIGGDCPALDEARLCSAAEALNKVEVVMGPAEDGGYYLLGLQKPYLALLEHTQWSTFAVAETTRVLAQREGLAIAEMPTLRDVDRAEDWALLAPLLEGG